MKMPTIPPPRLFSVLIRSKSIFYERCLVAMLLALVGLSAVFAATRLFVASASITTAQSTKAAVVPFRVAPLQPVALPLPSPTVTSSPVQVVNTWQWSPASPDPAGITFIPETDSLLVSDSEVDEITGAGQNTTNIWEISRAGVVGDSGATMVWGGLISKEPTGLSYDPFSKTLFLSSDDSKKIYTVKRGPDNRFGTADDVVGWILTTKFTGSASSDAEDPAFDPATGHLFFLNGQDEQVYDIDPVNGVFGDADDTATFFDFSDQAGDAEGLVIDQARDTILIGAASPRRILEYTKTGTLVRTISVSAITGLSRLSGLTMAPASDGSGKWNIWIVDRQVDNDNTNNTCPTCPEENDGKLFEITVPTNGINTPPVINSVSINPASPGTNDILTAMANGRDDEGDPLAYSYQWQRNGVDLVGQVGNVLDLSATGNGDKGDSITVRAIANDGIDSSTARTSAAVKIANSAPTLNPGNLTNAEGEIVNIQVEASDPDGDELTYAVSGLPPGLVIDTTSGVISGAVESGASNNSPYTVSITVSDGEVSSPEPIVLVQKTTPPAVLAPPSPTPTPASVTTEYSSTPTPGNLLIAQGRVGSGRTVSMPPGWQLVIQTDGTPRALVYYKVAGSNEPTSVTMSVNEIVNPATMSLSLFEYSGMNPNQSEVLDSWIASGPVNATSLPTGTIGTSQPSELLVASAHLAGSRSNFAWNNGFQPQTTQTTALQFFADRTVTAPGVFNTTASWNPATSTTVVTTLVSFKGAIPAGWDSQSTTDNFTWTITFQNSPPSANNDTYEINEDGALNVPVATGVLSNDTDPDSNPLTAAVVDTTSHGVLTFSSDGAFFYTPTADYNGPDSFTYTASDGNGGSSIGTVNITVTEVNDSPTAVNDTKTTGEDIPLIFGAEDLTSNDSTGPNEAEQSLTVTSVGTATNGTVSLIEGQITFTPSANYSGSASFTYALADDGTTNGSPDPKTATGTVSITVSPINDAPVASAQNVNTFEDSAVPITLSATDADDDSLTYSVVAGPSAGTLSGTAPNLSYTPTQNDNGIVSFTFKANDGTSDSNVATVFITIAPVNDLPTASADSYSTDEDTELIENAVGVLVNDTDAEGNPMTAVLVSSPLNGTMVLNANGSFTYTPRPGFSGSDSFTYRANDGFGSGNTATVTITVNAAAIRFGSASFAQNSGKSSITITRPVGVGNGDLLLAVIDTAASAAITSPAGWSRVSDPGSNTFMDQVSGSLRQVIYFKIAGSTEPASYIWNFASVQNATGAILSYTGVDTGTPFDVAGSQANLASTAVTAPSLETRVANTRVVGFFGTATNTTISPPGTMAERGEITSGKVRITIEVADSNRKVPGATGPRTATAISSAVNIGQLVALRPSGAISLQPPAPTSLTAVAGPGQVALSWTASAGALGYYVYRSGSAGGPYDSTKLISAAIFSTTFEDTNVSSGTTYWYVVRSFNENGESTNSNEATATTACPTLSLAPTGSTLTPGRVGVPYSTSFSVPDGSGTFAFSITAGAAPPNLSLSPSGLLSGTPKKSAAGRTFNFTVTARNGGCTASRSYSLTIS